MDISSDTLEVIARRYSCRAFLDRPVDSGLLQTVLTAGLHAPSAMNRQPWRFIVVRDKAMLAEIDAVGMMQLAAADPAGFERMKTRGGQLTYGAPLVIVIAGQQLDSIYSPFLDCGIAASHMALAATAVGLDSCIAAMPGIAFTGELGARLRQQVGLPEGFMFTLSLLLGYAAGEPKPGHATDFTKIVEPGYADAARSERL